MITLVFPIPFCLQMNPKQSYIFIPSFLQGMTIVN
jgi:hypothetical protein